MRRAALFGIMLLLSGCAYSAWWKPPFTAGGNPHAPTGDSENLRRVMGQDVEVKPLTPEPGDVWPGAVQALPTLQDVEQQGNLQPGQEQPVLGSPLQRGTEVPSLQPEVTRGSSTP